MNLQSCLTLHAALLCFSVTQSNVTQEGPLAPGSQASNLALQSTTTSGLRNLTAPLSISLHGKP